MFWGEKVENKKGWGKVISTDIYIMYVFIYKLRHSKGSDR